VIVSTKKAWAAPGSGNAFKWLQSPFVGEQALIDLGIGREFQSAGQLDEWQMKIARSELPFDCAYEIKEAQRHRHAKGQ
jgi:hypothetical protein